ncbi:MAG: outer membrane protein [Candidatus Rokuibacteriota bacterium]
MKKLLGWAVVVAVMALAVPGGAAAENFYAAVRGGVGWTPETRTGIAGSEDPFEFKTTWSGGIGLGYMLPFGLRVEGELGYLYVPVKSDRGVDVDGSIKNYLFMANAYYDLKLGAFKPFVGVGLGAARVNDDHESFSERLGVKFELDEDRTAFAYQARAGIAYEINQWFDVTAGYRYLHIDGGHYDVAPGVRINVGKRDNHSFELGFAIRF